LAQLCETELAQRRRAGTFKGNFSALSHFFGYEGRSGLPSDFDCNYCYTLGVIAVALLQRGCNGLMSCACGLDKPVQHWVCCGIPLTSLMAIERRKGRDVPVIRKALVELSALPFKKFVEHRDSWGLDDAYRFVGPIQFFGAFASETTLTLQLERAAALSGADQEARVKAVMAAVLEKMPGIQGERMAASLSVPDSLKGGVTLSSRVISSNHGGRELPMVELNASGPLERRDSPLKIAVVFCGRQTPGVSNVVAGLYNYIRSRHEHSVLLGARNGTVGFMAGDLVTVDPELLSSFVNRGGFDMLGRSFDMIRTPQQLEAAANTCRQQQLQGLVLVGGPVTVADGHKLQLYLKEKEIPTGVIVVPASIDNDLKSVNVEVMLGFDSACKEYTHLIGNVMMDACSAKKYWFFVRVMGRTSGHVALECALSTHPNVVLLGEEVKAKHLSLASIVSQIADSVCVRHNKGHDYGVVVIPEGLASSVPELSILLQEIDTLQKAGSDPLNGLSSWSKAVLLSLPDFIQKQLMLQFEAQGTPQLSRIEMERLLAALVGVELKKRKALGTYTGSFSSITHFFGYQGRCALPSLFDCNLGFALGAAAAALVSGGCTDMLATANGVVGPVNNWTMAGISLDTFLSPDSSSPPHIGVSVSSRSFKTMQSLKDDWAVGDECVDSIYPAFNLEHSASSCFVLRRHALCCVVMLCVASSCFVLQVQLPWPHAVPRLLCCSHTTHSECRLWKVASFCSFVDFDLSLDF
jgi:diphosphate--fructose-6-phosphate 1-phosphotransferase